MRLAKKGEIGILLKDDFAQGQNIGKQVHVLDTCRCLENRWMVKALEDIRDGLNTGSLSDMIRQLITKSRDCKAGDYCCPHKTSVYAKDDPDEKTAPPEEAPIDAKPLVTT